MGVVQRAPMFASEGGCGLDDDGGSARPPSSPSRQRQTRGERAWCRARARVACVACVWRERCVRVWCVCGVCVWRAGVRVCGASVSAQRERGAALKQLARRLLRLVILLRDALVTAARAHEAPPIGCRHRLRRAQPAHEQRHVDEGGLLAVA
eukprot:582992-Prymnesium_polylepis.1